MANGYRKLLSTEREELICRSLSGGVKTIAELTERLGVSEATVRRDLESLEQQGKIHRVHGGAELVKNHQHEPIFSEKASRHAAEKALIAEKALSFINDGDTIYLDGGSTLVELAKRLGEKKNLTVVTNSLMAAAELMETECRLIIVGGEFRMLSRTLVGPLTAKILSTLFISKAFLGTIGLDPEKGISTTDSNEAFTKELVMKQSDKVFVLADSSKIGVSSFAKSGSLEDIDFVITDPSISPRILKALKDKQVQVIF